MANLPLFEDPASIEIIKKIEEKYALDSQLLEDLCHLVLANSGSGRAFGIDADIANALDRCLERISNS